MHYIYYNLTYWPCLKTWQGLLPGKPIVSKPCICVRVKIQAFSIYMRSSQKDHDWGNLRSSLWRCFCWSSLAQTSIANHTQSKHSKQVVVALPGAKAQAWLHFMSNHCCRLESMADIRLRAAREVHQTTTRRVVMLLSSKHFCGSLECTVFVRWVAQPGWFYRRVAIICASVPSQRPLLCSAVNRVYEEPFSGGAAGIRTHFKANMEYFQSELPYTKRKYPVTYVTLLKVFFISFKHNSKNIFTFQAAIFNHVSPWPILSQWERTAILKWWLQVFSRGG